MAVAVIMPRQGQSVESCVISEWNKKEGDKVAEGDVLFSYETDKASFEEEAKTAGTLLKILAHEGDDVPVLETVAVIGNEGEDISGLLGEVQGSEEKANAQSDVQTQPVQTAPAPSVTQAAAPIPAADGRVKISPRAKGIAQNQDLDYTLATGTGPGGRIIERDILQLAQSGQGARQVQAEAHTAAAAPAPRSEYEDVKLSNVRKAIAKSMHASLATMAQLTHTSSFDAADIIAFRQSVKKSGEALGLANITYNDMVLFAVSRVLKNHRDLNAHFLDDKMRLFSDVHLGMAVDTPRGLLVPTIFDADKMTLNDIALTAKDLARQAQEGCISPDYLQGATFTVSNLGAFGIESFTPVINPPQTGILGVNTIGTRIRQQDSEIVAYEAMGLSLTYDHRAIDGAPASRFLQELCQSLESFTALLSK